MKIKLVGAGLVFIIIAWLLLGFDSPATGIALVTGMILLLLGCFPWACKLPWYVPSIIGGMLLVAAYFAYVYIPLIVGNKFEGYEDMPGALVNLIYFTVGIPGVVLMLAGVASACWRDYHR